MLHVSCLMFRIFKLFNISFNKLICIHLFRLSFQSLIYTLDFSTEKCCSAFSVILYHFLQNHLLCGFFLKSLHICLINSALLFRIRTDTTAVTMLSFKSFFLSCFTVIIYITIFLNGMTTSILIPDF